MNDTIYKIGDKVKIYYNIFKYYPNSTSVYSIECMELNGTLLKISKKYGINTYEVLTDKGVLIRNDNTIKI